MTTIEECREFWSKIAKDNGWYAEPFFVQVWMNRKGEITDSVSHGGLTQDLIIKPIVFVANIVTSQLIIEADNEEEAELKYDAYFSQEPCPCGDDDCECCTEAEEVTHYMERQDG